MKLKLVKKQDEATGTKSFFFTADEKFTWQAGQYAYITLSGITKQFTIASSPTEEFIQITTRIREVSEFKQKLNKLEIGTIIEAKGPQGTFVLNSSHLVPSASLVFLAGGIGITPFRSMIKYNIDRKLNSPMFLIYSNSDDDFVFKKDLDIWQKENNFIKVTYFDSSVSGHLNKASLNHFISDHSISSVFYAVGPPAFVNTMEDILEELKVPTDQIKTEKFTGY